VGIAAVANFTVAFVWAMEVLAGKQISFKIRIVYYLF
jgi:hypothetical protein